MLNIFLLFITSTKHYPQEENNTEAIKCPSCGMALEKIGKYCHECGAKAVNF